jgi:hypothetical protein
VVSVPADLQPILGRKQIWRSLQTEKYQQARVMARKVMSRLDQLFFQVRYMKLDQKLIDSMVAEFALTNLECSEKLRRGVKVIGGCEVSEVFGGEYTVLTETESSRKAYSEVHRLASEMYKRAGIENRLHELPFLTDAVDIVLRKKGIPIDKDSDDYAKLLAAFGSAEKALEKIEAERIHGDDDTEYQHRMISEWKKNLPEKVDRGIPFSELLSKYYEHQVKHRQWDEVLAKRKEGPFQVFGEAVVDLFGTDIGVKTIDEDKARELVSYLSNLPVYTVPGEISGKRLKGKAPVAPPTVNKWLEDISAAFNWGAGKRGLTDQNPFKNLRLPELGKKRDRAREFTLDELQRYADVLADTYDPARPEKTYIPLCMMFGGPRNNEVAQLRVDDLRQDGEIWYFNIQADAEQGKRTKSEQSDRSLPIHSTLIALGILRHRDKMREQGQAQLWPNLKLNPRTGRYYDDNLSAELNELVDEHISDDRKLRVYSLRSNFENAVEHKVSGAILDAIEGKDTFLRGLEGLLPFFERALKDVMGHAQKGATTDKVYRKARLRIMHRMVEQAEYGVDLSRLKEILNTI